MNPEQSQSRPLIYDTWKLVLSYLVALIAVLLGGFLSPWYYIGTGIGFVSSIWFASRVPNLRAITISCITAFVSLALALLIHFGQPSV